MNLWRWIARKYPNAPRGFRAQTFLAGAYQRVLAPGGQATDEDKEIVLADLANASGFFKVTGPGVTAEDRAYMDGMRAGYGRIHRFLRLTDDEARQLQEAARQEAIVDAQQGED